MKRIIQFVPLWVVVAASSAWADPVTITFDQPPCPIISSIVYASDCYRLLGVSFTSAGGRSGLVEAIMINADAHAVSPPNVARPAPESAWLNAEFSRFDVGARVNGVSFDIVGSQLGQPAWEVVFATSSFSDRIRGFGDQRVSAPRDLVTGLTFFPGTLLNAIDNLTFSSSVAATPEPSTLLLIGTGAVAAFARRRRRPGAAA